MQLALISGNHAAPLYFFESAISLCKKNMFHYPYVRSAVYFLCFKESVDYINTCGAFGFRMWFTFESDAAHLCPKMKVLKI